MTDYPVWDEIELRMIAAELSPAMRYVLLRCSEYTDWSAHHAHGVGRQWIDLVAGRDRGSMKQVRALMARELVIETRDHLYGLTLKGLAVRGQLLRDELW